MTSHSHRNYSIDSQPLESLEAEGQEAISEALAPREGIRFVGGSLCGIALCLPFWIWILWLVARHP
jgi:hypothetical protein